MLGRFSDCKPEFGFVVLSAFLLNALYFLPLVVSGIGNLGRFDSDYHFFILEAAKKSIFEYGQLPFWDPWHMGGIPLMGNVEFPLSPLYFPVLFFGTVAGAKVSLYILHCIGFVGTYYLARHLSLNSLGALTAALIWSFSGMHAVQIEAGWILFSHINLMPWAFLCFLKGKEELRFAILTGLLLALFFLSGVPYLIPVTILPLGVMAIFLSAEGKTLRPIKFLLLSLAVSLPVAAVKLIPSMQWLAANPRVPDSIIDGYSITALFWSLVDPKIGLDYPTPALYGASALPDASLFAAVEYGIYVGPIVLLLAVVGLFGRFVCKGAFLAALAALILVVMGDYSPVPLWALLRELPIYDSMRVVERFRWPLLLIISLLAAFGVTKVCSFSSNPRIASFVILIAIFLNLFAVSAPILYKSFPVPPENVLRTFNETGDYYQINKSGWYSKEGWMSVKNPHLINAMYPFIVENVGVVIGYEAFNLELFARGKGSPEYKGEVFIATPQGFLPARIDKWTPNRVTVGWDKGVSGDLYLNQNFSQGWSVCGGSGLKLAESGLIRVPISSGDSKVALCYSPVGVWIGIVISALSIIVAIAYIFFAFRKKPLAEELV